MSASPDKSGRVVIIGGGQAGFQVACTLRQKKYAGPIVLIAEEPLAPYQRPPLSKGFLKDEIPEDNLTFRPDTYYPGNDIDLRLDVTATAIDRIGREVALSDGGTVAYDYLVIATGARIRPLLVPGAELSGVHPIRTLEDAKAVKAELPAAAGVAVIGGGFIGLEAAAVCATMGKKVTVFEAADRLMGRVVAPPISEAYLAIHKSHGVDVRLNEQVTGIEGANGKATGVTCGDGTSVPADLVLFGIGVLPNTEIAEAAGLACQNGIVVDETLATSDPRIWAIGDCARFPHPMADAPVRLESVQNAVDQGKAVADAILGSPAPYEAVPWFWTDQYDTKLQMVGLSQGHDRTVTRGDVASGQVSVFYFREGRLIAIDSINRPGDHMAGRRLLASGAQMTPDQAADEGLDLKTLIKK